MCNKVLKLLREIKKKVKKIGVDHKKCLEEEEGGKQPIFIKFKEGGGFSGGQIQIRESTEKWSLKLTTLMDDKFLVINIFNHFNYIESIEFFDLKTDYRVVRLPEIYSIYMKSILIYLYSLCYS